jgi:hypothetical protein
MKGKIPSQQRELFNNVELMFKINHYLFTDNAGPVIHITYHTLNPKHDAVVLHQWHCDD